MFYMYEGETEKECEKKCGHLVCFEIKSDTDGGSVILMQWQHLKQWQL